MIDTQIFRGVFEEYQIDVDQHFIHMQHRDGKQIHCIDRRDFELMRQAVEKFDDKSLEAFKMRQKREADAIRAMRGAS